ncbi:group I intron splicing factor [Schizosaccharomyces japonicus yFS275]|uniref:Mitochondrial 15S rRNA processing factor ppr3 n=1 Tax=Schizosaccharomyces japonicus (strain yFS275 / FY16936) TaxID=402676 RepID=CCM1_SCHJY|nr:group I intron splicing factor [Schizosaccharomyces japonicus yFS275]B6K1V7.1 RecName: Full=Mitochondrial group I intron splicing factor dmr1; Flags: Precursor [Schizosaccharomyces japonicus yFS275]EEB07138.1 group I intron splicing factor [Schizosaccharomyces japonicus yFS275]
MFTEICGKLRTCIYKKVAFSRPLGCNLRQLPVFRDFHNSVSCLRENDKALDELNATILRLQRRIDASKSISLQQKQTQEFPRNEKLLSFLLDNTLRSNVSDKETHSVPPKSKSVLPSEDNILVQRLGVPETSFNKYFQLEPTAESISHKSVLAPEVWKSRLDNLFRYSVPFEKCNLNQVIELVTHLPSSFRASYAKNILDCLKQVCLTPSVYLLNILLHASAKHSTLEETLNVYNAYNQFQLKPDNYTFVSLIIAYSLHKQIVKAFSLLSEMKRLKIEANTHVFNTYIAILYHERLYEQAWRLFDYMKFKSLQSQPDDKTYSYMISVCTAERKVEKALNLYQEMQERPINPLTPSSRTIDAILRALARYPRYHSKFWSIFEELRAEQWKPGAQTFVAFAQLFSYGGQVNSLKRWISRIWSMSGETPDAKTIELLFQYLFRAYSNVKFNQEPSLEQVPNEKTGDDASISSPSNQLSLKLPFLLSSSSGDITKEELIHEAKECYHYLQQYHPTVLSVHLRTTYMSIFKNHGCMDEVKEFYAKSFRPAKLPSSHVVSNQNETTCNKDLPFRDIHVYACAINGASVSNDFAFGYAVWLEYLHCKSYLPEVLNGDKIEFEITKSMIILFARNQFLHLAVKLLNETKDRHWKWTRRSLGIMHKVAFLSQDKPALDLIEEIVLD